MTLTTKGQLTIPQHTRLKLGLLPGTRVVFDVVGDGVRIRTAAEQGRGAALVGSMTLLTRDPARYRTHFPRLRLLAP